MLPDAAGVGDCFLADEALSDRHRQLSGVVLLRRVTGILLCIQAGDADVLSTEIGRAALMLQISCCPGARCKPGEAKAYNLQSGPCLLVLLPVTTGQDVAKPVAHLLAEVSLA